MADMRLVVPQFHPAATAFGAVLALMLSLSPLAGQTASDMDALFAELAQTEGDGWVRAQSDIERAWSRSGSAALDLLLIRGEAALDAGDLPAAIGHLTALTENAPDFAAGWAARGAALALAGQTGPAIADLAEAVRIEPRHWPALTLMGSILEAVGDADRAEAAYRHSLSVNPHQEDAADGLSRLTSDTEGQGA